VFTLRYATIRSKRGITLAEILIALVIMMIVMVSIVGFMTRTRTNTTFTEARVFASSLTSDVMKNLLGKVPFYCIMANGNRDGSTSGTKYTDLPDTLAELDTATLNKSDGSENGYILADQPTQTGGDEEYIKTVLYHNDGSDESKPPFTVKDKRGISYYISLRSEIVPIKFKYYETSVHSTAVDGNYRDPAGGAYSWEHSFLIDPIDSTGGSKDEVFGNSSVASSDKIVTSTTTGSSSVDWLQGDVKDARLKRLTVTVMWAEYLSTRDKNIAASDEEIDLKRFSLMSVKAKLED